MAQPDELALFVKEALTSGVARPDIERVLVDAGWSARQVADALGGFVNVAFAIPVPRPQRYTDAREAFLYGVLFLSLVLTAYHFGALIFAFINHAWPTGGNPASLREATRWPTAILVVVLPVFLYATFLTNRDARQDPSRRTSKARSQMTYLTLFVCAATVIGVLAGVVYGFLGSELTAPFVLQSLTVIGIAAGVFIHYMRSLRATVAAT